jgi:hypothetical protein
MGGARMERWAAETPVAESENLAYIEGFLRCLVSGVVFAWVRPLTVGK